MLLSALLFISLSSTSVVSKKHVAWSYLYTRKYLIHWPRSPSTCANSYPDKTCSSNDPDNPGYSVWSKRIDPRDKDESPWLGEAHGLPDGEQRVSLWLPARVAGEDGDFCLTMFRNAYGNGDQEQMQVWLNGEYLIHFGKGDTYGF
jgi:hypothetical protein